MPEPEAQEQDLDFSQYLEILVHRRWTVIATAICVFLTSFLYIFTTKPVFQSSSLILIERTRADQVIYSNNGGGMTVEDSDDFYPTQYKLLKSDSLMRRVFEELHLDRVPDFAPPQELRKLGGAVTVSPVPRSRLVYLNVDCHDPELAAKIANAVAQAFVEQNLNNQLFMSKGILQALQGGKNGAENRRIYDSLPAVVNNQLLQSLKADYAKLQAQAADMSARYTPKHPAVLAVKSNMAAIQSQIDAETDKIVQSLKTELSGELAANNVRIIDQAQVPISPVSPKKRMALFLGAVGGLLLGFLMAYLVEMLDQSIRTQQDIESKLKLPFLGNLPFVPLGPEDSVYASLVSEKISLTSEAFRNLRTMIDFAGVGENSKLFFITSTVQEEGKSYIAANVAVAFAQIGEKVLLIDGDLRRPKLHRTFRLSSEHGISDFLATGKAVEELKGLVQATEIAGLSVLVCGTRPPNPSELLNTPRLGATIGWARGHFDRVIVDCAPMFPIHDTLLWGRHVHSAIFAVRYGTTRVPLIKSAAKTLETSGIKTLGAIVNAVRATGFTYDVNRYYKQYYQQYTEAPEFKKV